MALMSTDQKDFIPKGFYPVSGAAALKFAADWWVASSGGPVALMLPMFISTYESDGTGILFIRLRGDPVLIKSPLCRPPVAFSPTEHKFRSVRGIDKQIQLSVSDLREVLSSGLMSSSTKEPDG